MTNRNIFLKPFSTELNVAVMHIVNRLFPTGYDVSDDAPATLEAVTEQIEKTGRLTVYSGDCDHSIFGSAEINQDFRAWHDWCHWKGQFAMDADGERKAFEMQIEHLKMLGLYTTFIEKLLDIEINGQVEFFAERGEWPTDQRQFTRYKLGREWWLANDIPTYQDDQVALGA